MCWNLEPKCARASWVCEVTGDLDGAILWQERQLEFAQWLHDNGYGYNDALMDGPARLNYLRAADGTEDLCLQHMFEKMGKESFQQADQLLGLLSLLVQ